MGSKCLTSTGFFPSFLFLLGPRESVDKVRCLAVCADSSSLMNAWVMMNDGWLAGLLAVKGSLLLGQCSQDKGEREE